MPVLFDKLIRRWLWLLVVIGVWQLYSAQMPLVPSPGTTLQTGADLATSGELATSAIDSLVRVMESMAIVCAIALPLGFLIGLSERANRYMNKLISLLRPLPPVAWIPLIVMVWGIQNKTSLFLICVGAFFPVLINTIDGVRGVQRIYVSAAVVLGAKQSQVIKDVILPAALPPILTGVRVGIGIAWMLVVIAELVAVKSGLGYMILNGQLDMRLDVIIVGIVVIGFIGLAIDRLYQMFSRRVCVTLRQVERA